ncbi:hypothetical protein DYB32_006765 [Aphanomyces invadans]|uniref:Cation efflux protein transmembrane domain-containing protein n=1 Tax=Aphanomyces invadans TaxID=157072 RepID=A0A418AQX8_9STRA|nr:hypothetical protein DYB32_006765 [Aphanomyces invadans]
MHDHRDVLFHEEERQESTLLAAGSALTQLAWLSLLHNITFSSNNLATAVACLPWTFAAVGVIAAFSSSSSSPTSPFLPTHPHKSMTSATPSVLRSVLQGGLLATLFVLRMSMLHFCGLQFTALVESATHCLTEPLSKAFCHQNTPANAVVAIATGYALALVFPSMMSNSTTGPSLLFHLSLFAASVGLKYISSSFNRQTHSPSTIAVVYSTAIATSVATYYVLGSTLTSPSVHIPQVETHVSSLAVLAGLVVAGVGAIVLPATVFLDDSTDSRQAHLNVSIRLGLQFPLAVATALSSPHTLSWHVLVHVVLSFGALASIAWGWFMYLSTLEKSASFAMPRRISSRSILTTWRSCDPATQKILLFLTGNILYMFVEFVVGYVTNSLGLLSDAGHMLFDNGALVIGLGASMVSKWPCNDRYTFGYDRVEVLSGFVNSLLLVFMAVHFMMEAIERVVEPPTIMTDNLLVTSVGGLVMNVVGLIWFHDLAHGHSHGGEGCPSANSNMVGVYLHVLADTMGSVGVILSSICIDWYGWYIMDPLCSAFISVLIFGSTFPLLKDTMTQLVQGISASTASSLNVAKQRVQQLPFVHHVANVHAWSQAGQLIATVHVVIDKHVDGAVMHVRRTILEVVHVAHLTVQVMHVNEPNTDALDSSHDGHWHRSNSHGSHGHSHGHGGCSHSSPHGCAND